MRELDREAARKKIAALRAMTARRGCSEAEALAAASRAASLMAEFGLSEDDIRIDELSARIKTRGHAPRDPLLMVIALVTNTSAILTADDGKSQAVFVGVEPGPQLAVYLTEVLNRAIDQAIAEFKGTPLYRRRRSDATRRAAVADFTVGMVLRLRLRLIEMFAGTMREDLRALAKEALDRRFPSRRTLNKPIKEPRFHEASAAGMAAGRRVNLAHGVSAAGAASRLAIPQSD